jgi:hypothetical protein
MPVDGFSLNADSHSETRFQKSLQRTPRLFVAPSRSAGRPAGGVGGAVLLAALVFLPPHQKG